MTPLCEEGPQRRISVESALANTATPGAVLDPCIVSLLVFQPRHQPGDPNGVFSAGART
jgi:hypothetical protein